MDDTLQIIDPPGWPRPSGYANAVSGRGRIVFVAGQVGRMPDGRWQAVDFVGQLRQALLNTVEVLAAAGAKPTDIARMTVYVTDRREYLDCRAAVGACWREIVGRHYPAMTLVEVSGLVDERAKLEIETTALIPEGT